MPTLQVLLVDNVTVLRLLSKYFKRILSTELKLLVYFENGQKYPSFKIETERVVNEFEYVYLIESVSQ